MDLAALQMSDFTACVEQKFRVRLGDRDPLELVLVEVQELVAADDAPDRRKPFALIFAGPAEVALDQAIFRLENETLGEIDLFLVTNGPHHDGTMRHEAIFT